MKSHASGMIACTAFMFNVSLSGMDIMLSTVNASV